MTASRTSVFQLPLGKIIFEPGDTVRVRQLGDQAPRMVVQQAVKVPHETEPGRKVLIGIMCFWYVNGICQEKLYNTKDLEVLEKARKDFDLSE